MANLKEVKNRIVSVASTQQITKAMKMVAAAKLRYAQENIVQMRPYYQQLLKVMNQVTESQKEIEVTNHFLADDRPDEHVLLVVISSDRGLCGGFNSGLFKYTHKLIDEFYDEASQYGNIHVLPIGKKSYEYFRKQKYNTINEYYKILENIDFLAVKTLGETIITDFLNCKYDKVVIIYNQFKNVATQVAANEILLPVQQQDETELSDYPYIDYLFEPKIEIILEDLIPKYVKVQLYKAILESVASEHGARMTAMDKATENANELLKELKLTYNRTRQAAITKEILEIVGGAEALSNG